MKFSSRAAELASTAGREKADKQHCACFTFSRVIDDARSVHAMGNVLIRSARSIRGVRSTRTPPTRSRSTENFPWLTTSERTQTKSASSFCMSASKCAEKRMKKNVGKVGREEEKFYIIQFMCRDAGEADDKFSHTHSHQPSETREWDTRKMNYTIHNHIYSTGKSIFIY